MVLGLLFNRRKKQEKTVRKTASNTLWVSPFEVKRIVIDGREILVRKIISLTEDEIVYEDPSGVIRSIKRVKPEKTDDNIFPYTAT